jgi:hypothetical protein
LHGFGRIGADTSVQIEVGEIDGVDVETTGGARDWIAAYDG